ncbi:hypothetical protein ACJRPK_06660 [Aquimarina sp. 2-A2]|uniref:hypothetical protein n=1 Tax=Aquimarina sp. 2-A2 TaxID=3382644 RepID=UPI00387EE9F4
MILPLTLSENDPDEAQHVFIDFLKNEPVTVLLVLGSSDIAIRAVEKCTVLINSSDIFYKGVRVVHAPNISLIKDILFSLKINPRLKPLESEGLNALVMISITNVFDNVADYVAVSKLDNRSVYYIDRLIFRAMAYDKDLTAL